MTYSHAINGMVSLIELQKEKQKFEKEADNIQQVSPICQQPNCFYEVLDEAVKIGHQQAIIWNDIRGFITKDGSTLWQLAIKNNFIVKSFGEEDLLKLEMLDLEFLQQNLIPLRPKGTEYP